MLYIFTHSWRLNLAEEHRTAKFLNSERYRFLPLARGCFQWGFFRRESAALPACLLCSSSLMPCRTGQHLSVCSSFPVLVQYGSSLQSKTQHFLFFLVPDRPSEVYRETLCSVLCVSAYKKGLHKIVEFSFYPARLTSNRWYWGISKLWFEILIACILITSRQKKKGLTFTWWYPQCLGTSIITVQSHNTTLTSWLSLVPGGKSALNYKAMIFYVWKTPSS